MAGLAVFGVACLGMPISGELKDLLKDEGPVARETLAGLQEWTAESSEENARNIFMNQLLASKQTRIVHTGTVYVCGSENKIAGIMKPEEIISLLKSDPNLEGRIDSKGEVWLEKHVAELSATCKEKGYIGLDATGSLSLFEGRPEKEKVMRTFFQIDIKSMESSLPKEIIQQLHNGIRVQDLEEYNSVISTFSDYAMESEGKMKR
ncbi:BofC C-terminal domain-containing protein [Paenibacillus pinistramenti]|uniref:BofC C-terminal domain-containing protein n=1 Tax=Paenibacillus pinistramenti TaxID=1768003 RepID=UPI001EF087E7|nr:BofC C-terminal domain-containing protein [Paenibacillus pinistramenti]